MTTLSVIDRKGHRNLSKPDRFQVRAAICQTLTGRYDNRHKIACGLRLRKKRKFEIS